MNFSQYLNESHYDGIDDWFKISDDYMHLPAFADWLEERGFGDSNLLSKMRNNNGGNLISFDELVNYAKFVCNDTDRNLCLLLRYESIIV